MQRCFCLLIVIPCMLLSNRVVVGQNYGLYGNYYVNGYLYNPAEAATDYTYILLDHRQQWMGIDGAPQLTTLSYTTRINETKSAIGGKVSNYSRGILTTTDLALTYVYGVNLTEHNRILFGLSGGLISNSIDLTDVDASDAALSGYLQNNMQPVASFGFLYRSASGLNLGVALPQLFNPVFNGASHFENFSAIAPTDNIVVSAYFRRHVEKKIVSKKKHHAHRRVKTKNETAPLELYALYRYSSFGNSQIEGSIKYNFSDNVWLAGTYRLEYGVGAGVGFRLNKLMVSYNYELPSQPIAGFTGSHEVVLGLRLGERKEYQKPVPMLRSQIQKEGKVSHIARFQQTAEDPDHIEQQKHNEEKRYLVIVNSFKTFDQADAYKRQLVDQKFTADIYYHKADQKYYVHIFDTANSRDAYDEARNVRHATKLKKAYVMTVTEVPKK